MGGQIQLSVEKKTPKRKRKTPGNSRNGCFRAAPLTKWSMNLCHCVPSRQDAVKDEPVCVCVCIEEEELVL